jgi:hypothetical protein
MEMTAKMKSIPTTCYINQCASKIIKRPTSSRCLMMSTVEHFEPKLYTCNKFSTNNQKKEYGGNIKGY